MLNSEKMGVQSDGGYNCNQYSKSGAQKLGVLCVGWWEGAGRVDGPLVGPVNFFFDNDEMLTLFVSSFINTCVLACTHTSINIHT